MTASAAHKNDKELVLAAVTQKGHLLDCASKELQADNEVVLAAVAQDSRALVHAAEALRRDPTIVLAAVTQNGMAVKYAHPELLIASKEIMLVGVAQDFRALEFAPQGDESYKEIALAAFKQPSIHVR